MGSGDGRAFGMVRPEEGNGGAIPCRIEKPASPLGFWMIYHFLRRPKTERPAPFWCTLLRNLLFLLRISVPSSSFVYSALDE
jgi:hypothetical protein